MDETDPRIDIGAEAIMRRQGWSYRTVSPETLAGFKLDAEAVFEATDGYRKPPVSDLFETLALIAEYRMLVKPRERQPGWYAGAEGESWSAWGSTIGDAVRACVQRIKSAGDGGGTE